MLLVSFKVFLAVLNISVLKTNDLHLPSPRNTEMTQELKPFIWKTKTSLSRAVNTIVTKLSAIGVSI